MTRRLTALLALALATPAWGKPADLSSWAVRPARAPGVKLAAGRAELRSDGWTFLAEKADRLHTRVAATFTVVKPASRLGFFGQSWSVWPDPAFADGGYDAGLLLRAGQAAGYRVQLSHRYQDVALIRYPAGGYLRVVPCRVAVGQAHRVSAAVQGNRVVVTVDGQEKIRFVDHLPALPAGAAGVGAANGATVAVERVEVEGLPAAPPTPPAAHAPRFSARRWLGGRPWVFDGDEPILLLPTPADPTINNVKLRPGLKPMLSWNAHWDISNQGAYPDGANTLAPVQTTGGGKTLTATWTARQKTDRFATRTALTVGWDARRAAYTFDVDSELEVLPGKPFHFRYGYDFEHHTPLDPFRWQYLALRRDGGKLEHRPVYPIDPGAIEGLATRRGLRLWYGRHGEAMEVAPAVEYDIQGAGQRRLSTAVCAAFYDTGVSFGAETAKPGTKVRVKYRYTGYPAREAEELFRESTVHDSPMLDPNHHYVFADEWPRLTFRHFVPMSKTWIYGRRPFMTGHNRRPTYELVKGTGTGSGYAMRLGPGAFGATALAAPPDLAAGRYALVARCRADNVRGPGGRVELSVTAPKTGKVLAAHTHYLGTGSFGWKTTGFLFEVPVAGAGLTLGLGNAGTGEVDFAEVEVRKADGARAPAGVAREANRTPARLDAAPAGALADYRMEEGKGRHVLDHARGPLGMLELNNVGWVTDEGRPALKFADELAGRKDYPRCGALHLSYLRHPGYAGRDGLPVALAGHHGGAAPLKAFTVAAWVKPAARMGKAEHGGAGDVVGLGARRVVLKLLGQSAPYRPGVALNVNDRFEAPVKVEAGRWCHLAVTGEPTPAGPWRVRLFVDGKQVQEGVTKKLQGPLAIPPSLILGAEIFYFHDAYYRGLIGRTTVLGRALTAAELAALRDGKTAGGEAK